LIKAFLFAAAMRALRLAPVLAWRTPFCTALSISLVACVVEEVFFCEKKGRTREKEKNEKNG
jgi:hypothetical protein